ncbi:geranylgeranyl reductase family protein [Baaleninema simplex]|uniref:geranylgeranyl reductase family protein n=1 Tax=Baaleninema simplex TaxID=2862350 RepID=UPI0003644CB0|nr:geranylgeranyl reductase family protein [Baaleninema simplex]
MLDYDVIVCGAGPSGATAAARAARAGLRVALLEKRALPRHKPCGGGMPMQVDAWLRDLFPDTGVEVAVESQVRQLCHTWNFGEAHLGSVNLPESPRDLSLWMVQRPLFDNALVRQAVRCGAQLRDGLTVRSLDLDSRGVTVRASRTGDRRESFTATARQVIGADGANGIAANAVNLRQRRQLAIAMEVELPYDWHASPDRLRPDVAHLEYGAVRRGYAWIFPKGESLNVGAGVFHPPKGKRGGNRFVRDELERAIFGYFDRFDLNVDRAALKFYAHPLPLWQGKERRHSPGGRILLVGDAAGLVNPFFGDGILHGIKSGIIAADCIAAGCPQQYTAQLHAEVAANFNAARLLAAFFYRFPDWCYRHVVRRRDGTHIAARLLAGDLQFSEIVGKFVGYVGQKTIDGAISHLGAPFGASR